eukprot:jgi/Tetstr1/446792/TSEL_034273.t1
MSIAFRLLLPFIPPGEHAAFARSQQPGSLPSPPPRSPADPLLDAVPLVSASWDSGQRIYADPHARRRPRLGIFRLGAQEARKIPCSMGPRARKSTPRARLLGRSRRRALGEDSVAVFSGSCPIFTGSCHNIAGASEQWFRLYRNQRPCQCHCDRNLGGNAIYPCHGNPWQCISLNDSCDRRCKHARGWWCHRGTARGSPFTRGHRVPRHRETWMWVRPCRAEEVESVVRGHPLGGGRRASAHAEMHGQI